MSAPAATFNQPEPCVERHSRQLTIQFKSLSEEAFLHLTPENMEAQARDVVDTIASTGYKEFRLEGRAAGPVTRLIGSNCPGDTIFHVESLGCKQPVVVSYPPQLSGRASAKFEIKKIYSDDATDGDGKLARRVVFWLTMNPTISMDGVPERINASAGGDRAAHVRALYACVVQPDGSKFMDDMNSHSLVAATFEAADTALALATSEFKSGDAQAVHPVIGLISGLPPALTLAFGMRFKQSIVGWRKVVDYKLNDGGYVCVGPLAIKQEAPPAESLAPVAP